DGGGAGGGSVPDDDDVLPGLLSHVECPSSQVRDALERLVERLEDLLLGGAVDVVGAWVADGAPAGEIDVAPVHGVGEDALHDVLADQLEAGRGAEGQVEVPAAEGLERILL